MTPYAEALKILKQAAEERGMLPSEELLLNKALGRVASQRLLSAEALPSFDNSSMDGYAVRSEETVGASPGRPVRLKILGAVAAGDPPRPPTPFLRASGTACRIPPPPRKTKSAGAFEINTGAPLPHGFDAVVKIEDARLLDGGPAIELKRPAAAGDWVRRAGQDFKAGTPVLAAGTLLEPSHILALAALGHDRVYARRKARVAVISTGRELVAVGKKPEPGQIRNASSAYLMAALSQLGAEARFHGIVPDDPKDFCRRMKRILAESPDIILTTGAVSMGRHDFVTAEVRALGAKTLYHKVAIRPGKPGLAASFPQGPLLFGLPGNPVSTVVGLRFFVLPYLRRLFGQSEEKPLRARLEADTAKPEGLRCFFKARVSAGPKGLSAQVLPGQASFQIRSLLDANAWVVLPEKGNLTRARNLVETVPLWPTDGK